MFDILWHGGPALWIIALTAVITLLVFVRRWQALHYDQINTRDFLDGIYNVVHRNNMAEAISNCEDTPGPVPYLVRAGLLKADEDPAEIHIAIQQAGMVELPRLEAKLGFFATIARIAPFLGLLGTVTGMLDQLHQLYLKAPLATPRDLGAGLHQALLATAAGLLLAIGAHSAHQVLLSRVAALINDMEIAALGIFSFLARRQRNRREGVTE
ncbi:MAG: MotA/TolQ/ExbB proton channel family protein [Kiritimatiellia bacterium]